MKIILEEDEQCDETTIHITCFKKDSDIEHMITYLKNTTKYITCEKDSAHYHIRYSDILYFESVDDRTYLYTLDGVYSCNLKLYVIEKTFRPFHFVRISKSCIVNIHQLISVRPLFDGKFEAICKSKEILIINRHYVTSFKEAFGI